MKYLLILLFTLMLSCNNIAPEIPVQQEPEISFKYQALDADTLFFSNEVAFRNFLRNYGLADYEVLPKSFVSNQPYLSVVPNELYYFVYDSLGVAIPTGSHYLHEEPFANKYYVSIKDHSHTWKFYNEMVTVYCPSGTMNNVTEYITNPYTGQVVAFKDVYNWSNRDGMNIHNLNLKLWLLWDFAPGVVSFEIDAIQKPSMCDYTFEEYFPGHETMELRFHGMEEEYGWMRM